MKKLFFTHLFPIVSIYIFYVLIVLIGVNFKSYGIMLSLLDVICKWIAPFVLGIILSRIVYRKTLSKKCIIKYKKDKTYLLIIGIFIFALIIIVFITYIDQNGVINDILYSANYGFDKLDNKYNVLQFFIPYNPVIFQYWLSAFLGFSFYRIMFDKSLLENK